jgi:LCP family protein required for cell wall assembly
MGRAALRVWVAVLVALVGMVVLLYLDRGLLFGIFTRPTVLMVLTGLLVVGGLWWAYLFFDAWRLANPRGVEPGAGRAVGVLAAFLAVLTAGSMLYGASIVNAQRDMIAGVFGSGTRSKPVDGRYNVLLLGGDAGKGRVGTRTDSINLVSIDAGTGSSVMFSLPRNLQNVPFPAGTPAAKTNPEGYNCGNECLLNAIFTYGVEHPDLFQGGTDPGTTAVKQAVEGVTGLKVNYYVLVELEGFQGMIDAMGGVTIDVKKRVPIGGGSSPIRGWIEPGKQKMNGKTALWYARSREGSSDYERMARQRCVMTAMAQQMDPQTLLTKFQQIASASKDLVSTDVPGGDVGTFVDLGLKGKSQKITSVQFVPPLIKPAHPDFAFIQQTVKDTIAKDEGKTPGQSDALPSAPSMGSGVQALGPSVVAAGTQEPADGAAVDARAVCQAG